MKVWISKYALTKGIYEADGKIVCSYIAPHLEIYAKNPEQTPWIACFFDQDWHETKEAAIKKAEAMREKKIASLQKKIKKLEEMTFE